MFHRRFRPAQEELSKVILSTLFCCVWYALLLSDYIRLGFRSGDLIFIVAGLPFILTTAINAKSAMFYRKQRKDAIKLGHVRPGRIVEVITTTERERSRRRYVTVYYYSFEVEVTDPLTGASMTISSDPYDQPIHRYLGSPSVKIYTDSTGWKHYLEDFQLKKHHSDPGIFPNDKRFNAPLWGRSVYNIIYVVLLGLLLLNVLGGM